MKRIKGTELIIGDKYYFCHSVPQFGEGIFVGSKNSELFFYPTTECRGFKIEEDGTVGFFDPNNNTLWDEVE